MKLKSTMAPKSKTIYNDTNFTEVLLLIKTTVSFQFAEVYFRWKGTIIRPILSREEPFVADAFKDKFFEVIAKIVCLGVSIL